MVEPSKSGGGAALRRAAAGVALPVGVVYVIEGQEPAPLLFSTGAGSDFLTEEITEAIDGITQQHLSNGQPKAESQSRKEEQHNIYGFLLGRDHIQNCHVDAAFR